jgi:hypothetical protein
MNLHMHDEGSAYGEDLTEQIITQFTGAQGSRLALERRNRRAHHARADRLAEVARRALAVTASTAAGPKPAAA